MPIVPYVNPDRVPPLPQSNLPVIILTPVLAFGGFGGMWLIGIAVPSVLLLVPSEEVAALILLRACQAGYLFHAVLGLLSPLIFVVFAALISRFMCRNLAPKARKEHRMASFLLAPFFLPLFAALMWGTLGSGGTIALYDLAQADIQQIEAGMTEHMTVFISGRSAPDALFTGHPEGWQVKRRTVFGPDTGRSGITLRFPEALESTLDPEGFALESWDNARWYEVTFTSGFHLVVEIMPVGGEEP